MSTIQNTTKSVVRVGKNYIKGYSDVQIKVRDATSNDPWGPSGAQMNELAQLSYNQNDFIEMMELLDKRLNDKGKNWRHVFKALTVLDYLIHAGSENVIIYFRDNLYLVKTLKEFQHIDDYGKDQGANVRQKAKDITNLLQDEGRLREERRSRANMRDRMGGGSGQNDDDDERERRRRQQQQQQQQQPRRSNKEEEELKRAIEESKRMAREQEERIRAETKDEEELQRALALSKAEEEKRIKELETANQNALFDDSTNLDGNNVYNNQQVDFFGNPLGVQPQYTSFNPYLQAQQTGYNPFLAQQMQQQQMMQQQYMQQQAEYQRQLEMQAAAQQYQQLMTQQPIQPQPTAFGSNNPFAFGGSGPSTQQQQPSHNVPVGNLFSVDENPSPAPQPQPQPPPPQPAQQTQQQPPRAKVNNDDRFAELNRMLASGDGIDTFGNVGDQRYGHSQGRVRAQQTGANGVGAQPTGNNPFFAL